MFEYQKKWYKNSIWLSKENNEHVKILIIFFEKILLLKIERVIFWAYKISSSVKACNNQINVKQIQRQINKLFRINSKIKQTVFSSGVIVYYGK